LNKSHLGDAYDYVKKSLLEYFVLEKNQILTIPLFTEPFIVENNDLAFYSHITGSSQTDIIKDPFLPANRDSYLVRALEKINHHLVVFIDPDTGLSQNLGRLQNKYLNLEEVVPFASRAKNVIIYDQSFSNSRSEAKHDNMRTKLHFFFENSIFGFYVDLQASFLFLSKSEQLIQDLQNDLVSKHFVLDERIITLPKNNC